jgi:hypothetical protein
VYQRAKTYVRLAVFEINSRTTATAANRQDEIAETVANMIAKIAVNPKLAKVKKTPTLAVQVRNIIGQVLKISGAVPPEHVRDLLGSASITVHNTGVQDLNEDAIKNYLTKFAAKSQLLGNKANAKNTLYVAAAQQGLNEGFGADNGKYEDGTRAPLFIDIADPETDFRPA